MTTKITWTHVDAHVRKAYERTGMLPVGGGDAEVAYSYLRYVERQLELLSRKVHHVEEERDAFRDMLRKVEASPVKQGKIKRRLDALEKAVEELRLGLAGVATSGVSGEGVNDSNVPKADPFGPRDGDGWYAWNGDDTMRPGGRVDYVCRASGNSYFDTGSADGLRWNWDRVGGDIVKWRPAQ